MPPNSQVQDTVSFKELVPFTSYRLLVRCPWVVQAEYDFVTSSLLSINNPSCKNKNDFYQLYSLSGILLLEKSTVLSHADFSLFPKGIYLIVHGTDKIKMILY